MANVAGFRRVVNAREAADSGQKEDPYLVKLLKYIPAEAITAYPLGMAAADTIASESARPTWYVIWFGFLLLATPIWTYIATNKPTEPPKWRQIVFAPIAFALWFLNVGDAHVDTVWRAIFAKGVDCIADPTVWQCHMDTGVASLMLIIVTIVVTMIEQLMPKASPSRVEQSRS